MDELGEFLVAFELEKAAIDAIPRGRPPTSVTRGPALNINEAARYLELKVTTFKRLLKAGLIVGPDFGRELGVAKKYWYQSSLDTYHSPIVPEDAQRGSRDAYGTRLDH
jgi:hypothetical protein